MWAITTGFRECLSRSGEWTYEMRPSERENEWIAEHRFSLEEALERAPEECQKHYEDWLAAALHKFPDFLEWK